MPDLPRVLTDAPADDLQHVSDTGRRFTRPARVRRALALRRPLTAPDGTPDLGEPDEPDLVVGLASPLAVMRRRLPAAVLVGALALGLAGGLLVSSAQADDLTSRRDALKQQISKTRSDLNESSAALSKAGVRVDEAESRLEAARAELSRAQTALAAAKAEDTRLAAQLKKAQTALAKAKAAVLDCQEQLDAKKQMVGVMVRTAYQQQTNLMPIAVLTSPNTADLATRMQWATTMFDTTQSKIDDLLALESQLKAKRAQLAKAEAQVAQDRAEAADALSRTRSLEAQARSAAAAVADQLAQRQAVEKSAAQDVAADKQQYSKLTTERASVESRIAARIAREKRAAAKAAAAQRAAEARAARQAAARAKASHHRSSHVSVPRASSSSTSSHSSSGAHHGFIYPVSAPITSPYGMRFHPVLHYWKLHDGTDFGAGCGTAMHAAYDGVVAEKYFNAGYGNRLMIDHGKVDGRYVTTGYNHAIRYVVSVGQHVKQGQVIGYVGTTGFSTGCHLHLMVWLDGKVVNPMSWY